MERITGSTRLTGLLGKPVAHSLSPLMHNEAFRLLGLDYAYLAFDVEPADLKTAVAGLKAMNARGFNLTMPHKTMVCDYVDRLTPAASLSHSVNTVINDNGVLTGHTTDGAGYLASVRARGIDLRGEKMTLLGLGGAGTAICVQAALDQTAAIDVFKRKNETWSQAVSLADNISRQTGCSVSLHDLADKTQLRKSLEESCLLTNATSVGMAPGDQDSAIEDASMFPPSLAVSDIIYDPRETRLMSLARSRGCQTFNGLYMLLYQGAESFRCWTGQDMPVDAIREKYFKE